MPVWIALLRGVNVGANRKLNMKAFAGALADAGLSGVRTYIQSGNVVFRSKERSAAKVGRIVEDAVERVAGFRSAAQALSAGALRDAVRKNPFSKAEADHKSLHLFFLSEEIAAKDLAPLRGLVSANEDFALVGRVFYLYSKNGLSASKLAEKAARLLGPNATARNWRTANTLLGMAEEA